MTEDILALAARHVAEGEERVMQQQLLVEKLERQGFEARASDAKLLLATMQETLVLMRDHLCALRSRRMV